VPDDSLRPADRTSPRGKLPSHANMRLVTLDTVPERLAEVQRLNDTLWPEFLLHGDIRNWSSLYTTFSRFQLVVLDGDVLMGAGFTAPFAWEPNRPAPQTIDEVVFAARWPLDQTGGVLCALAALVVPEYRLRGTSREIIRGMCGLSRSLGLAGLLAPVRPTLKHQDPFEPMSSYIGRKDERGRCWDPWLRVHEELGGRRLGIAHSALTVRASVKEWERWAGKTFGKSGAYAVDGGLVPVQIDLERDLGEYREPNVWYFHSVKGA
jgi:hypothetical protein